MYFAKCQSFCVSYFCSWSVSDEDGCLSAKMSQRISCYPAPLVLASKQYMSEPLQFGALALRTLCINFLLNHLRRENRVLQTYFTSGKKSSSLRFLIYIEDTVNSELQNLRSSQSAQLYSARPTPAISVTSWLVLILLDKYRLAKKWKHMIFV